MKFISLLNFLWRGQEFFVFNNLTLQFRITYLNIAHFDFSLLFRDVILQFCTFRQYY